MKRARIPLWFKLTIAAIVVEALVITALMLAHLRHTEAVLQRQARANLEGMHPLLNSALAGPLVQRDLGALHEILREAQGNGGFDYLALLDQDGQTLAKAGLGEGPLPTLSPPGADLARISVLHAAMPVRVGDLTYGELRFGMRTDFFVAAHDETLRQGVSIGLIGLLASSTVLALSGFWLTRRLQQLTQASRAIAGEDFDARLPQAGRDEVGQLVEAFRAMALQIKARLSELRDSEQRFSAIANYTYDLELWIDPSGRTIWVNPSARRILGYSAEECIQMPGFPLCLIVEDDQANATQRFEQSLSGSHGEGFQFRMRRKDGGTLWAAVNWHPVVQENGAFAGVRASIRDISDLKDSEQRALEYLKASDSERARLMALLSAMDLGILFVGENRRVIYHNPAFNRLWLFPENRPLAGEAVPELFNESACRLSDDGEFSRHAARTLQSREPAEAFEIPTEDGRLAQMFSFPVFEGDQHYLGHLWVFEDITSERRTAEQLLYLAERDALTGLYNRHRFQLELDRMLDEAARHQTPCALLYFDLDEFKAINDHFGHKAGDALLVRVAGEVAGLTRRHEMLFRLGGDEFAVMLPNTDSQAAQGLAERIVRAISLIPFRFENTSLHISSSLGIALYPQHAADSEQLVVCADAAMYQAKQAGKNAWRLYRRELDTTPEMLQRLSWNERITRGLEQGLFELHYQGVYQLPDLRLSHLEALIRLRDEDDGTLVPPGLFIPVAEKSNKILEIDRWVIREAARVLAARPHGPRIAVNLSGRSFDEPGMPAYIVSVLGEYGLPPQRLIIEITETAAVSDLADAERFIEALKRAGCEVCLDDFGAGFASFAYLKHIRVDTIKLDGMFIRNLPHDPENQVFVRGMVEVARGLGKATVAECVEDESTLKLLVTLGVNKAQGYFLGRPLARHPALEKGEEGNGENG